MSQQVTGLANLLNQNNVAVQFATLIRASIMIIGILVVVSAMASTYAAKIPAHGIIPISYIYQIYHMAADYKQIAFNYFTNISK